MSTKTIETSFIVSLPKGKVIPTKFVRYNDKQATGIDPNTGRDSWIYGNWTIGKDIVLTADEALAAGEDAKLKRIASLRKQLAKLESMTLRVGK